MALVQKFFYENFDPASIGTNHDLTDLLNNTVIVTASPYYKTKFNISNSQYVYADADSFVYWGWGTFAGTKNRLTKSNYDGAYGQFKVHYTPSGEVDYAVGKGEGIYRVEGMKWVPELIAYDSAAPIDCAFFKPLVATDDGQSAETFIIQGKIKGILTSGMGIYGNSATDQAKMHPTKYGHTLLLINALKQVHPSPTNVLMISMTDLWYTYSTDVATDGENYGSAYFRIFEQYGPTANITQTSAQALDASGDNTEAYLAGFDIIFILNNSFEFNDSYSVLPSDTLIDNLVKVFETQLPFFIHQVSGGVTTDDIDTRLSDRLLVAYGLGRRPLPTTISEFDRDFHTTTFGDHSAWNDIDIRIVDPSINSVTGSATWWETGTTGLTSTDFGRGSWLEGECETIIIPPDDACKFLAGDLYEAQGRMDLEFLAPDNATDRPLVYEWSGWESNPEISVVEGGTASDSYVVLKLSRTINGLEGSYIDVAIQCKCIDSSFTDVEISDTANALMKFQMCDTAVGNEPTFSITDATVTEPEPTDNIVITLTVKASEPILGADITLDFATSNVSAESGSDYGASSGSLTFASGETTKTIPIDINYDTEYESTEVFKVLLSNLSRGTFSKDTGTVTINEWIVPTMIVELAQAGTVRELFVIRDTSGSTNSSTSFKDPADVNGKEVFVNGVKKSRRELMDQIIEDYNLATKDEAAWLAAGGTYYGTVAYLPGHGQDWIFDNPSDNINYSDIPGATSQVIIDALSALSVDPTSQEVSILIMNDSSDSISAAHQGASNIASIWSNELANIPTTIPVKLTVIRVIGDYFITGAGNTGNYSTAAQWFEDFLAGAPSNVEGFFDSYSTYTTGGAGDLNDILSGTVNNTYNVFCNTDPSNIEVIEAPDEATAQSLSTLSC